MEPRTAVPCWPGSSLSRLLHDGLCSADLPLDLLAGPASGLHGAGLELAVRPRLLDHRGDPFLAERISQLAVRIRVCKIAVAN